ncbi:MAG: ABC transporter substrate-binding protein [bacterium]
MKRSFEVAVASLLLLLASLSVVSSAQMKYKEAPMLAELVKAGKLPPVEKRLPEEPVVIEPLGEIGRYGGRLRALVPDPRMESPEAEWFRGQNLASLSPDLKRIVPNIAKSWELSSDHTTLTVRLRKGLKWSDGVPLTTEDVRFWYEDVLLNKELTPRVNPKYAPGGEVMKMIIDDDYTFRYKFAVPYPIILDFLPTEAPFMPKHYLKKFHIKYNDKANEIAKSERYEMWWESFQFHSAGGGEQQDANYPTLASWVYESADSAGNRYYVRNPYYWKVDTAGNQLPYIDYLDRILVENLEVLTAKVLSGDTTHASWFLKMPDYPLLKENEKKGGYVAGLYPDTRASEFGIAFNYTHKDPVLKKIFNDIRWRKAMSHAINRDEINEIRFMGLGVPRQPIADPGASFYEEGMDQYYVKYDPELANRLLDEMGLKWDAKHEWRLRPDGKPLKLTMEFWAGKAEMAEPAQLIKGYWKAVGVDLALKPEENQFYRQRLVANETDMGVWAIGGGSEIYSRKFQPIRWRPPWHWPDTALGGVEWWNWYESKGKSGEEPPEVIKHLFDLVDQWQAEPRGTKRYEELGKEILRINAENCWLIGTVGLVPRVAIIKNNLRNVPKPGQILSVEYDMWKPYLPEQWWFAK